MLNTRETYLRYEVMLKILFLYITTYLFRSTSTFCIKVRSMYFKLLCVVLWYITNRCVCIHYVHIFVRTLTICRLSSLITGTPSLPSLTTSFPKFIWTSPNTEFGPTTRVPTNSTTRDLKKHLYFIRITLWKNKTSFSPPRTLPFPHGNDQELVLTLYRHLTLSVLISFLTVPPITLPCPLSTFRDSPLFLPQYPSSPSFPFKISLFVTRANPFPVFGFTGVPNLSNKFVQHSDLNTPDTVYQVVPVGDESWSTKTVDPFLCHLGIE